MSVEMVYRENAKQVADGVVVMVLKDLACNLDTTLEVGTLLKVKELVHFLDLGKHS